MLDILRSMYKNINSFSFEESLKYTKKYFIYLFEEIEDISTKLKFNKFSHNI